MKYVAGSKEFRIDFPGKPVAREKGSEHVYEFSRRGEEYRVTRKVFPKALMQQVGDLDAVLDTVQGMMQNNAAGKLLTTENRKVDGYPGREVIALMNDRGRISRLAMLIVLKDDRLFMATARNPGTGTLTQHENAARFFESFSVAR